MKIERFEMAGLSQYSYVVSSGGRAAVVDAMRDIDHYLDYAKAQDISITHVLETHIHADFAAGSVELAAAAGAELALSGYDQGEHYRYTMPHRRLLDGGVIELGSLRIESLHTPGHTPEHVSFVVYDQVENVWRPAALLSGDFLFVGSLGRPDLLGEVAKVGLAGELYRSLHERIATLPDSLQVYPGHGAGSLCGSGMGSAASSTLGLERTTGPLFRLDKDAFVREVLASVPEMPAYYPRMKALNASGSPQLGVIPGGFALPLAMVETLARQEDVQVVDVRSAEEFAKGHIPAAIHLGAGPNLPLWAGWLLDPEKRILLVGNCGDDEAARRALVRVGLDRIDGFLLGGMEAWIAARMQTVMTPMLSVDDVKLCMDSALLLDVRNEREWATGHIDGARFVPLGEINSAMASFPEDRPLITVCGSGYRASTAASLLARAGFRHVSSLAGGMAAWRQEGNLVL